jgi:hypothetical protein
MIVEFSKEETIEPQETSRLKSYPNLSPQITSYKHSSAQEMSKQMPTVVTVKTHPKSTTTAVVKKKD